ncbi:hypothetical protein Ndes2526A_g00380 [Nannochloris sp. 'desiccata']|nr:hypothetical protein KSW81_003165 [Chlorella desiccata (nom. nud.)]
MYTRLKDVRRLTGLPETIEVCLEAPAPITVTKFNPFGTILASGSSTGDIFLWAWSTRGISRTFSGAHTKPITSLLWSSDGRQLASTSLDGSLVIWEVLSGSKIVAKNLERGGILHVSAVLSTDFTSPSTESNGGNDIWLQKLEETSLLLSYEENEAQIINFKDLNATTPAPLLVPVAALEGPSRGARLLTNAAAAASGQRVASSPCGKYIASAARGVVCLISALDLRILDAVKIKGVPKQITSLVFGPGGKQLLLGTTDRFVRIYNIITPSLETSDNDIQKEPQELARPGKGVDVEYLIAVVPGDHFFPEGSFIHQQNRNLTTTTTPTTTTPSDFTGVEQLKLTRLFDAQVEKLSWGACAFSPDGQHLVTAIDSSSNEHVIYTWNIPHGYAENTLQAGSDGIVELTWHPEPAPMQCLAVGKSGKIYVWAKVMTQDWSAFAPDFETLADNREHIEEETEFDIEVKVKVGDDDHEEAVEQAENKKTKKKTSGKNQSIDSRPSSTDMSVEDEIIDIESWDWLDAKIKNHTAINLFDGGSGIELPSDEIWKAGWSAACTAGPLLHLPVIWPTEAVKDVEKEEEEAVLMAVDEIEGAGGGGQEEEKLDGLEENGEGEKEEEYTDAANKKARIK